MTLIEKWKQLAESALVRFERYTEERLAERRPPPPISAQMQIYLALQAMSPKLKREAQQVKALGEHMRRRQNLLQRGHGTRSPR